MPAKDILGLSKELDVYIIVVDARVEQYRLSAVWVDNVTAFIEATEYLIDNGHEKIGFVAGPLNIANSKDRYKGYLTGLQNHGIDKDASLIYESDFTIEGGYRAAKRIFEKTSFPPTAVVCSNDLMAVGVLSYLRERGIKVPNDVSIIGCDDIDVASSLYPPLTTVVQPIYELGVTAAQLMLQYTTTGDFPPNSILHAKLVVRQSTAAIGRG
jgi:DNA-binding LacI/PurR family transcriptional regulator